VPKRFTLKPGLSYDHDHDFTRFEIKLTNGSLGLFGVGYRYGFDADNGGHEVFIDWGTKRRGRAGFFIRQSPSREKPTYGFALNTPEWQQHTFEAVYVSQGDRAWRASLVKQSILDLPWAVTGLSLDLIGLRRGEKYIPPDDTLWIGIRPEVKVFPWGERHFPFFPFLARPYLTAGAAITSPLSAYNPQLAYEASIGTDLLLFGLYPRSFSVGARLDNEHKVHWQVELLF
jgi:hypothetical protein